MIKPSETATNKLGLARNQTALATRATILAFVFTMPISHTYNLLYMCMHALSLYAQVYHTVGQLVCCVCALESSTVSSQAVYKTTCVCIY